MLIAHDLKYLGWVQAPEQSPALREGSVLCLEDRKPLGRIEEILGPVMCPIYALRYAGDGGTMPAEVAPGARVCSVDRFSHKLEEADLSAKVNWLLNPRVAWMPVQLD